MNTTTRQTGRSRSVRIADAVVSAPFADRELRPMVTVEYDDGDRFVTYAVPREVV
jgi:hypothetical protein